MMRDMNFCLKDNAKDKLRKGLLNLAEYATGQSGKQLHTMHPENYDRALIKS